MHLRRRGDDGVRNGRGGGGRIDKTIEEKIRDVSKVRMRCRDASVLTSLHVSEITIIFFLASHSHSSPSNCCICSECLYFCYHCTLLIIIDLSVSFYVAFFTSTPILLLVLCSHYLSTSTFFPSLQTLLCFLRTCEIGH